MSIKSFFFVLKIILWKNESKRFYEAKMIKRRENFMYKKNGQGEILIKNEIFYVQLPL